LRGGALHQIGFDDQMAARLRDEGEKRHHGPLREPLSLRQA